MSENRPTSPLRAAYRLIAPVGLRRRLAPLKLPYYLLCQNVRAFLGRDGAVSMRIRAVDGLVRVSAGDERIYVAATSRWNRYLGGVSTKCADLAWQYGHGEVYKVEEGDTVIDIGANCGEYAMHCASRGATVYALEADPRVFVPLTLNVRAWPAIRAFNLAVWNENRNIEIFSSPGTADSSAIRPETVETVFVQRAVTLDSFAEIMGIGDIKVIKCDAEGGEPEVLQGAAACLRRARYVAFDCGPERQGQPTFDESLEILRRYGFELAESAARGRRMLFARNTAFKD